MARAGLAVVLVHHTSKPMPAGRGQAGSSGKSPLGYRAWNGYGRAKVLVVKPKNATAEQRSVELEGTNMANAIHELAVNFGGNAPVWRRLEGKASGPAAPRKRGPERVEAWDEIDRWMVEHCQGTNGNAAGAAVAERFGGAASTRERQMSGHGPLRKRLDQSGKGVATA